MSDNLTHWSHPGHSLKKVDGESKYACDGCKMDGTRERYRCQQCNFDLHPDCMLITCPNTSYITMEGQKCQFLEKPCLGVNCKKVTCTGCRSCDACGMTVKGFVYHCPKTDWDFHPKCAKLKNKICIDDVTFWLEKQGPSKCAWCKKKRLEGAVKKIPGWSYICKDDINYSFHVYCMMNMAMQSSSSNSKHNLVSTSSGAKNMSLALQGKNAAISKCSKKWLNILEIFLGAVFSILLGDPTTILASAMAHLVIEGLSYIG